MFYNKSWVSTCREASNEFCHQIIVGSDANFLKFISYPTTQLQIPYPHLFVQCFNAFLLLEGQDSSSEIQEIFTRLILYMFEGRCILPDQSFFEVEFLEYLSANEDGVVSKEGNFSISNS